MLAFDFFFFQAEDGIRDSSVTGVQTCALPICPLFQREMSHSIPPKFYFLAQPTEKAHQVRFHHLSIRVRRRWKNIGAAEIPGLSGVDLADERSEERRVGKECRSRWSPYH